MAATRFVAGAVALLILTLGCARESSTEKKKEERTDNDKAGEVAALRHLPPGWGEEPVIELSTVAWSPDGRLLLTGYRQAPHPKQSPDQAHIVHVWDMKTGERLQVLKGHDGNITFVAFLPDSKRAVTAGGSMVKMWDAREGKQLWSGKVSTLEIKLAALSPDGKRVLTWGGGHGKEGRDNCTLLLWDAKTGKLLRAFEGYEKVLITRLTFSPDCTRVYVRSGCYTDQDIYLRILDASDGKTIAAFKIADSWKYPLAFSPDGKLALSERQNPGVGQNPYLVLWDILSGKELRRFEEQSKEEVIGQTISSPEVHMVAFTPDGKQMLSGDPDGRVRVWDVVTGKRISSVFLLDHEGRKGLPPRLNVRLFSPDGKMALTSNERKRVDPGWPPINFTLWDVSNGKLLRRF